MRDVKPVTLSIATPAELMRATGVVDTQVRYRPSVPTGRVYRFVIDDEPA